MPLHATKGTAWMLSSDTSLPEKDVTRADCASLCTASCQQTAPMVASFAGQNLIDVTPAIVLAITDAWDGLEPCLLTL